MNTTITTPADPGPTTSSNLATSTGSINDHHPTVCALCNNPPSIPCPTCQGLLYCSADCQGADAPIHRHVCSAFSSSSPPLPRPALGIDPETTKYVLGVLFPVDRQVPELVWVRIGGFRDEESGISFQEAEVGKYFELGGGDDGDGGGGGEEVQSEAIHSERNRVRNRDTRSMLEVWHVPGTVVATAAGLKENASIQYLASVCWIGGGNLDGGTSKPFHDWRGPVLVLFMTRSTGFMVDPGAYRDCQLQDFRDAVDFAVDYGNDGHQRKIQEVLDTLGKGSVGGRVSEAGDMERGGGGGEGDEEVSKGASRQVDDGEDMDRSGPDTKRSESPLPTSFVIEMEG